MKKKLLLIIIAFLTINLGFSQADKAWKEVSPNAKMVKHQSVTRDDFPTEFKLFQLNVETIKQSLSSAPDRKEIGATGVIVTIPNINGKLERFEMFEASNFDEELQTQYPNIRAYAGRGLDDKTAQARLSFGVNSLQTMVFRANKPTEFMEPYTQDATIFAIYSRDKVLKKSPFTCLTEDEQQIAGLAKNANQTFSSNPNLRTFRLALSCVAEYSNYFGATSAAQSGLVLTAFNNTMTRVNGVNNRDFAIHMNIVAASTNVIYYNPATDPYSDGTTGSNGAWNAELQNNLSDNLTGLSTSLAANNAAYDIGHLFGASGGGGNAGCIGCVCTNDTASTIDKNKGSGFTSPGNSIPSGDSFDIDYVAHEMGHQLGANHTFTHSNEDNAVNYEPGSGSTIMAYAGITTKDVQGNSDDYFHAGSINQVQTNMTGKTCDVETALGHGAPVVNAGADYTIPKSTPFTLTGSATDSGGGALTYCWEQYDDASGASQLCSITNVSAGDNDCVPIATKTTGPVFRSYQPTSSSSRTFPLLQSVLNASVSTTGSEIAVEFLPSVARTLNFRLTARDNSIVGGGGLTNFEDMIVTVANKDALTVTMATNTTYPAGSSQTVVWTGATGATGHSTIAGGANVDILFSADNGATWSTLLAGTTNDGSQAVTLPSGVAAPFCRFMVKASANIFFNVSASFSVGYVITNTCNSYTMNTTFAIPDNNTTFTVRSINVPTTSNISDVNLAVNLTHTYVSDLQIILQGPMVTTTQSTVFSQSCTSNNNINATFDDQGTGIVCAPTITGNVTPSTPLSIFNGLNPNGNWLVGIRDVGATDTGNVVSYTLTVCSQTTTLSSDNFGLEDFTLYPNPNNGNFNIQFTSTSGNEIKVNVHDVRGREIYAKSYTNNGLFNENLQLDTVQSGIYLVTVQDGSRKEVKKIVVQ